MAFKDWSMKNLTNPTAFIFSLVAAALVYSGISWAAVSQWSTTDATNASSDATITWTEGQAPSTVNDSARAMMGRIADWYLLIDGGTNSGCTVGGTADAITLTCSPATSALAAGQRFAFRAGSANTGAVTLNVDGLGATALRYRDGALVANDIAAGDLVLAIYDSNTTRFQLLTAPRVAQVTVPATQAQQETGTSTAVDVTPGRQQYHASASKAWAAFQPRGTNGAATIDSSYNVSGVSRTAAGTYEVSFTTAMSSGAYTCTGTSQNTGPTNLLQTISALATTKVTIVQISASTAAASDLGVAIHVICMGDL